MAGKTIEPTKLWDLARARILGESLRRGSAPTLISPEAVAHIPALGTPNPSPERPSGSLPALQQFIEINPEACSLLDQNLLIASVNKAFTQTFGFTVAESSGHSIDALLVPHDRAAEVQFAVQKLQKGERIDFETRLLHRDGTSLDISLLATPIQEGSNLSGVFVVYRDISEQRRAQALSSALCRIAERSSTTADLQQVFAAIHNIVSELIYARNLYIALADPENDSWTFPYYVDEENVIPAQKHLGRGLTEYVFRTGAPLLCHPGKFDELVKQGEIEPSGALSMEWLGVPIKRGPKTIGVLAVHSYCDNVRFREHEVEILTLVAQQLASAIEHKRYEEAIQRSEWRYRSFVQSAVYGIYRATLAGRFLDVNPALVSMLGYDSADELLSLDPRKTLFQDARELDRLLTEYKQRGRLDGLEVKWRKKDGNVILVRLNGRAVSSPEATEELLEIFAEDITERRELEAQFRQAQKMEAVGRLAGGVAHDFNNLLMVISGYTEVLLDNAEESNPHHHQQLVSIQQAADRATTLTRQLLAFSRKQLMELKVVDVNAIVADMERLLRPLIGEDVQLETHLDAKSAHTRADAGQLEQVLMNLVVNARDAMPDGGKITITTGEVSVDDSDRREHTFLQAGKYVLLSVTDTGCGMDEETQSRIFEPFFTTKDKGKGTGLGLSTVYGIVKQSNGYIVTQSKLGLGTTFRIYLPLADENKDQSESCKATTQATGGSETVLLVEDEESVRELVRQTLQSRGYNVLEAENGEAGLEVAANHSGAIHILISDVVMPGMGGRALAEQMKRAHPELKILFLSGYTEDAVIQGGLESGTAFLQKPFTLQALTRKVREVLST
jgi:two-component system cell cycle sensor histidine kinase/response regulator CckA